MTLPRWLRSFGSLVCGGLIVFVGLIWLVVIYWEWFATKPCGMESRSTTARNVGILFFGLIAIGFGIWRGKVASRQAKTAQRGLLNERYQRSAETLGSPVLAVRLGGIYALVSLAREHPNQHRDQVMSLLCAFVRYPTKDESAQETATPGRRYPRLREDVQAAVTAIMARGDDGLRRDGSTDKIDLRGAYLQGAGLALANLSGADLDGTDMTGASLSSADLSNATMTCACLHRAHLLGTDLSGARFLGANLSHIVAQRADFSGADLSGASLSHAQLQRADLSCAHISIADLTGASLRDANLSGASFGKGTRVTASDPPVSEIIIAQVTQAQLDEARADPDNPPKIDPAVVDAETGAPLVWRGKVISELPGGCGPIRA